MRTNRCLQLCIGAILILFNAQQSSAQKIPNSANDAKSRVLTDKKVEEVQVSPERLTPSLILFGKNYMPYSKGEAVGLLRNYLQLRAGYDDLLAVKETNVSNIFEVPEFQQYYKGVKVEYSKYKALSKDGQLLLLAGSFYQVPDNLPVKPVLSSDGALQVAKKHIGATRYVDEDILAAIKATNDAVKIRMLEAELKESQPGGELVIIKDFTNDQAIDMRLAYKFNLYASQPLSRGYIFVDALTGKILLYNAIIKHASVPTTVTTRYAGNRVINVKQVSGNDPNNGQLLQSSHPTNEVYVPGAATYVLIDDTKGKGIETYDMNGVGGAPISLGPVYAQAKSFTDVDNNWTLAQHKRGPGEQGANEAENDDIAWDAHWGASMVYDYWKNIQGRLSYDNNNAAIKSFIHYGPAYDNAFWNGTAMTYGDGSGEAANGFKPLTSLDVCGHEIGHGVCSFTSDLVYANESGAMNEGLSDIWAAAIENYAIRFVDNTLSATYKPFFIGEQISATPLRRMDNPKLRSDPDTYGGQYWINPNCTPTLANDQCGVHTNSGILNKWFYLLTVGSGNGSGPDASYAIPGVDDGLKDNGAAYNTIPYSVTGVGFEVSERITYLTELLLSSTATYAEFRNLAIGVASAYSGDPCSPLVQSVTNAMFAIGVGPAFTPPCITTFGFIFQPGITISENSGQQGCDAATIVNVPVLLPANSTVSFSFTGTATLNVDYTVSGSMANTGPGNKLDTLRVTVYNDAVIEGNETIVISGLVTNAGASPVNSTFTININDDDVLPVIGKDAITLLSENFDSYPQGFDQPSGWTEVLEIPEVAGIDPTANGRNQWGVFDAKLAIAPKLPVSGLPGTGGTYNSASTSQTRISPPKIDARGLTNVQLKFDYVVQGEVDANGTDPEQFGLFDYMAVIYSFDGTSYLELGPEYRFASAALTMGTFSDTLPAFLNNQQFFIGFRWVNDANAGGPNSITIDNLVLKADPRKIESDINNFSAEKAGPNQEVYFYSQQDGQIIAKVNSFSSFDYGCTNASIQASGNTTFELYNDDNGSHKVSDKVIRIIPANNNVNGAYDISLYLSEAEIAAIEGATSKNRNTFVIYKTSSATIGGANAGNTVNAAASYTNLPGVGGVFTAPFSTGFSGFAIGTNVPHPLPVTCLQLKGTRIANVVDLSWDVATEQNNHSFEVERSNDGVTYSRISTVSADIRKNGKYRFTDNSLAGLGNVYYRIKQTDANGSYRYVCNTLFVKLSNKELSFSNIYPNPVKGNAFVKVSAFENNNIRVEVMNAVGQMINGYTERIGAGNNLITIKLAGISAGSYMVRFKDQQGNVLSTQPLIIK